MFLGLGEGTVGRKDLGAPPAHGCGRLAGGESPRRDEDAGLLERLVELRKVGVERLAVGVVHVVGEVFLLGVQEQRVLHGTS